MRVVGSVIMLTFLDERLKEHWEPTGFKWLDATARKCGSSPGGRG
jgi:hypothetical protein